ncbi:hypothetical protein [Microbacterium caowuchunii]|uniref:Tail terminator n=1 Tax=Microbacterium caowuchunii TaxID=2614638 RepID=A0A5N0TKA6_9MICO|nr:hypothetical protein [Microbacterium caowuchunii]KAA9133759.1 hypothetical protein F6B40_08390 [Microbacterium caowuchunii]
MVEILVPADDEVAVVDELKARMEPRVGTKIPNPRPAEFLRVLNVGGVERDLVSDSPTLTIEAFAENETRARRLCALAVAYLQAAGRRGSLGGVTCYGVRIVALPANLPMPTVPDRSRFTATVSLDLRKVAG